MGKLGGKVAIISGAARGQGEAEARALVAEGARVVLGVAVEGALLRRVLTRVLAVLQASCRSTSDTIFLGMFVAPAIPPASNFVSGERRDAVGEQCLPQSR
jgi:NAD(P)-dependent dehydrogenase (short-subunit alcohol dehydrogenase family)